MNHKQNKMKFALSLLLLLCALSAHSRTELIIVGTAHEERPYINSDSIYNILVKLKPDVVLIELDSTFFTEDFHFDLQKYPDLLSTNENIGAERFQSRHRVDLRPFDISGRNEYFREMRYFENEYQMFRDIYNLFQQNKLGRKDREDFTLILYALELGGSLTFNSVQEMNSDLSMRFWRLRHRILYPKMVSIVKSVEELHHWIDFAIEWEAFWHRRNAAMADNIRKIANEYNNKRIVVLVGIEHKLCLLELLLPDVSTDFVILCHRGMRKI